MSSTKLKGKPIINYAAGAAFLLFGMFLFYCFFSRPLGNPFLGVENIEKFQKSMFLKTYLCMFSFYGRYFEFFLLALAIGSILISVGLFSSMLVLSTIGAALGSLSYFVYFICLLNRLGLNRNELFTSYVCPLLYACSCLLLALSEPLKKSRTLALVSATLWFISIMICILFKYQHKYIPRVIPMYLPLFLYPVGAVLYAFKTTPNPLKKPVTSSNAATGTKIESLSKLSDLLDKGIISQEEFEAKKQNILNS